MVQVPKLYAPTPAQSVAAARGMPVSKVASLDHTIDEANRSNITYFEEEFTLREDLENETSTQQQSQRNLPHHSGRLAISSQFFTSLMNYMHASHANDVDPKSSPQRVEKMIHQAIQTYETNAKIIYGNSDIPGTQLSIRL